MNVVFLTAGTGSYYCGACMRDNALARELQRMGHEVTIAPLYLPLILDEPALAGAEQVPVFFGGINVFLQQKLALFRHTPAAFDRLLNSTGLLKWAARHSHMTSARDHGEMTLEMLQIDASRLRKELENLMTWLEKIEKPDLVCLSNALLAGFAGEVKRRIGSPVVVFFQGEDLFLDGLPEPFRSRCWAELAARLKTADLLLSPTRFYADYIGQRLALADGQVKVAYNGIQLEGYSPATTSPATPTIGYLARMSREKGLWALVDAFIALARDHGDGTTRLKIGGAATAGDERGIAAAKQRLAEAGLEARVSWHPNLTREEKIEFLRSLTLFSVPVQYPEAFGLYLIEAMACGVPVVQPRSAAFPELVEMTGGGRCVNPGDPSALAAGWNELLREPDRGRGLGQAGRDGVLRLFGAPTMAQQFLQATAGLVGTRRAACPAGGT